MPSHYLAWHATVARHGITFSEQRFYELAGWSTRHLADMLVQEFGANISGERLAQEKEAEFQRMTVHIVPIQPVIDIAAENRGKLPMAVATSGMRKIVTPILEELKILDWFDALVTADDVKHAKPAPDIFLEAARRLNVEPSQCLVYEDAEAGFESARRAGMRFVDVRPLIRG